MGITSRPADDVWAEIQEKCRALQRERRPVETIVMRIPNMVTAVLPARIERKSEIVRGSAGGPGAPAHRSDVAALWRQLNATGRTKKGTLRFAFALVALIDGVEVDGNDLVLADPGKAGRFFVDEGNSPSDATLAEAIQDFVEGRAGGQRPLLDSGRRKAVELRAMEVVEEALTARKWKWEDVSKNSSYDLLCTRRGRVLRVEVKGTSGGLGTVLLTRREVDAAREDPASAALAVVYGIMVAGSGTKASATGGTLHPLISPWRPGTKDLTVVTYQYAVPLG